MAEQVLLSHRSNWQLRSAPESRDMEPWLNKTHMAEVSAVDIIWPSHSGSWFVMRHIWMHPRRCGVMQQRPGRSFSQETLSQRWWLQGSAANWSQSGLRIFCVGYVSNFRMVSETFSDCCFPFLWWTWGFVQLTTKLKIPWLACGGVKLIVAVAFEGNVGMLISTTRTSEQSVLYVPVSN